MQPPPAALQDPVPLACPKDPGLPNLKVVVVKVVVVPRSSYA